MTPNPLAGMTPDQIGPLVASAFKWSGPHILEAMIEALTDANFHTAAAALAKTWHEVNNTEEK